MSTMAKDSTILNHKFIKIFTFEYIFMQQRLKTLNSLVVYTNKNGQNLLRRAFEK
jgi:hypothetical protein